MTDQIPGIKTYSPAEVAEMVLPPDMKNGVRWLERLNDMTDVCAAAARATQRTK
jgi:hypothetical protein